MNWYMIFQRITNLPKTTILNIVFDTNTSNFTASDNQGNAEVEVWKKYKVKQSPLKISYKPTGKGVHKVKVTFTNKRALR